ncbi:MAG: ATP-dependent DNA/RNA helicase [Bogoriella megaspora]|nr:MAG: ATP-dependent DNA/RNA helicase [Bogoriella megaspora]
MAFKRKLDDRDVPREAKPNNKSPDIPNFDSFGLDARLLQGISHEKYACPTQVQSRAIPLALEGKDIIARSKTGSGKTAAYVLPVLQSILRRNADDPSSRHTSTLILVPTKELASQVASVISSLSKYCSNHVRCENVTRKEDDRIQRARLVERPDIVVATPSRAATHFTDKTLSPDALTHLVIDEADLVLSYGYEDDLLTVAKVLPKGLQVFFMSATLGKEVDQLKELFGSDPQVIALEEQETTAGQVSQFMVRCAEDEKFLLAYAVFKLKLIKGKCIIFVADIDRCYRLKLFLEQFGVKSCVLNSELPVNSRIHVVEEFNRNIYDIIIASDENEIVGSEGRSKKKKARSADEDAEGDMEVDENNHISDHDKDRENGTEDGAKESPPGRQDEKNRSGPPKKKQKTSKQDKEYGVSRGIDFKNVACVVNFDLPVTSKSYTHRIGRTARAGKAGMALSFVIPKDQHRKHKPTSIPSTEHDEEVIARIIRHQEKKGQSVQPYQFDMKKLDGFRYRMADALRAVTRIAIREARARELRQELLKSEKLKRHFEENPADLQHLRHDGQLHTARIQHHLKHVPDYLLPGKSKQGLLPVDQNYVGFHKPNENRIKKARMYNKMKKRNAGKPGRGSDPLKTFNAKGRGKK